MQRVLDDLRDRRDPVVEVMREQPDRVVTAERGEAGAGVEMPPDRGRPRLRQSLLEVVWQVLGDVDGFHAEGPLAAAQQRQAESLAGAAVQQDLRAIRPAAAGPQIGRAHV